MIIETLFQLGIFIPCITSIEGQTKTIWLKLGGHLLTI